MSTNTPYSGPQLNDSVFEKSSMINSKFNGVDLSKAEFYAVLSESKFTNCNMESAAFDDINMKNATFHNANLSDAKFSYMNLSNAEFSAVLNSVKFIGCNMEKAGFDDANLSDSKFHNINLSGAKFTYTDFTNVELEVSEDYSKGMKINGILLSDLMESYESK